MSMTRPESNEATAPGVRRPWEAPMLSELSLRASAQRDAADGAEAPQPPVPDASGSKPGLSWEFSFPMAVRSS
jgi:hypothetical protein